mmetsp:Transcript_42262/g.128215  ORF Transcript_42262/g.128215 Transcript_42262/m.128215 type:complete len:502 (-) Transcript_42262:333-1838(-)
MTRIKKCQRRLLPNTGSNSCAPHQQSRLMATSGIAFLSVVSAFTASPPTLLVNSGQHLHAAIRFAKKEGTDIQSRVNGGNEDASSTQSSSSFSSNVFIVDDLDKPSTAEQRSSEENEDANFEQTDGTFSSSRIFIVDEVKKLGVRTTKDVGSDESSSEAQHLTDLFISTHDTKRNISSPFYQNIDYFLKYIPIVSPVFAYLTYEQTAKIFDIVIEALSERNWYAVDGGQYQTQIITPAVNGIVVPAISILFATLIANTVSTLRQRQLDIRITLNTEAGELRVLQAMVDSFPEAVQADTRISGMDSQDRCRSYLIQYTNRLLAESQPEVEIDNLMFTGSMDSELIGLVVELNKITTTCVDGSIPQPILSESYAAVTRLNAQRSTRISAIQSTYPALHYVILSLLAASICTCFVIESDQQLLIFLTAVQLKILWTMLIGTFSALGVVCYDLGDPFRGYYQITKSLNQLNTIRDAIKASDQMKKAEKDGARGKRELICFENDRL